MAIVRTLDVFCDSDGCGEWTHGQTGTRPSASYARKVAARQGFHRRNGKDYCPWCWARLNGLPEPDERPIHMG